MRRVVLTALVLGLSILVLSPSSEAKRSSFKQQAKKACAASCGGGGYNKCRVVGAARPNQCPPSTFVTP
jgi:hypothetical protein